MMSNPKTALRGRKVAAVAEKEDISDYCRDVTLDQILSNYFLDPPRRRSGTKFS